MEGCVELYWGYSIVIVSGLRFRDIPASNGYIKWTANGKLNGQKEIYASKYPKPKSLHPKPDSELYLGTWDLECKSSMTQRFRL